MRNRWLKLLARSKTMATCLTCVHDGDGWDYEMGYILAGFRLSVCLSVAPSVLCFLRDALWPVPRRIARQSRMDPEMLTKSTSCILYTRSHIYSAVCFTIPSLPMSG